MRKCYGVQKYSRPGHLSSFHSFVEIHCICPFGGFRPKLKRSTGPPSLRYTYLVFGHELCTARLSSSPRNRNGRGGTRLQQFRACQTDTRRVSGYSDDTGYRSKPVLEAVSNTCYSINRLLYPKLEWFANSPSTLSPRFRVTNRVHKFSSAFSSSFPSPIICCIRTRDLS